MTIALILAGAYVGVLLVAIAWRVTGWAVRITLARLAGKSAHTADSPAAPHVVVTLVHGTFARRADWTIESSTLCRTIRETMHAPVRFERFLWSGWNTVTSRSKAVERLILHLAESHARWPHARHFIVGHSHGGNIAFQAMRDETVAEHIAGVVCLSTPFLWASPRNLGPVGRIALWWFPVVIALVCLVPAVELLPLALQDAAGAIALVIALGAGFVFSPWATKFAKIVAGALQYPDVQPRKVLIVRSFGDEASAALGAAHMISWIAEMLWSRTSRLLGSVLSTIETWRSALARRWRLLVPACVVLIGLAIVALTKAERGSWLELIGVLAAATFAVLIAVLARGGYVAEFFGALLIAVLASPSFLVILALGIATGPELLVAALLFRVTPESTPPGGGWTVWQVPKDPGTTVHGAELMHSTTYEDKESLAIVSQWLIRQLDPTES